MSALNPFVRLTGLLAPARLQVARVVSTDGTSSVVALPSGELRVRGTGTVGGQVYVRAGVIEGDAPSMQSYDIEV